MEEGVVKKGSALCTATASRHDHMTAGAAGLSINEPDLFSFLVNPLHDRSQTGESVVW